MKSPSATADKVFFWLHADCADYADVTNKLDGWTMSAPAVQLFDWTAEKQRTQRRNSSASAAQLLFFTTDAQITGGVSRG